MSMDRELARLRGNFAAGLAVVLPAVISIAVFIWLFGTVSNLTDLLLIFFPKEITHQEAGQGPMYWYWSVFAFLFGVLILMVLGQFARNFIGKKVIQLVDMMFQKMPLLGKIYMAIKQVNEAFTTNNRNSFKQVALVEFPREGMWSIGFVTGDQHQEVQAKTRDRVISIFVPTTPNPTTGFLILVAEDKVTKLDMTVADASKFIISLGSVSPIYPAKDQHQAKALVEASASQPTTGDAPAGREISDPVETAK